jgi:hypothetical protein
MEEIEIEQREKKTDRSDRAFRLKSLVYIKPGGLDVETNRDRDRERP